MAASVVLLLELFLSAQVRAGSLFYQFTNVFAGTAPDGSPAWVNSLFSDATPGTVQLKISANGLAGGEYLSAVFFNLDPSLNPTKLSFSYVTGSGGFASPTVTTGANAFEVAGQSQYDIEFTFSQKAAADFSGNDYVVYDITSSAYTLTAADFDYPGTGGASQFFAAAEIAGIRAIPQCVTLPGCCSSGTGWIAPGQLMPVPEPRTAALLALAAGLGAASRWQRRRAGRV